MKKAIKRDGRSLPGIGFPLPGGGKALAVTG
ncbi:hypothetical protein PANA5342_pPANA10236 (plasmid) [Pantoea ananatis LMG 5342]|nr:hypothetical protein PANA5342_pPANA10236 [Pantoea ananatis LMG 5342]